MDKHKPASARVAKRGPVIVRRATLADVEGMHALINRFAGEGLMLAKSRSNLYQNIRDFYVAEIIQNGQTVLAGCAALHVLWVDLGEIRSMAVDEACQGIGVGRSLAVALLKEAEQLRLPRVFALTYVKPFFECMGFVEEPKSSMPQKVWGECYDCPKFPDCDEVAVVKDAPFLEEGSRE